MKEENKKLEYKGYTIVLTPRKELCSNYALVVMDEQGREIKHSIRAGETEASAFEYGKRMVDFEVGYKK